MGRRRKVRQFCRYVCRSAPSQTLFPSEDNPLSADIRQCAYCSVLFTNETVYRKHWCWGSLKGLLAIYVLLCLFWQIDASTDFQIYTLASQSISAPSYLTENLSDIVYTTKQNISESMRSARVHKHCTLMTRNISAYFDETEYYDQQIARMNAALDIVFTLSQIPDEPASQYKPIFLDIKDHSVFADRDKTHQRLTKMKNRRQVESSLIERSRKRLHMVLNRFKPSFNMTKTLNIDINLKRNKCTVAFIPVNSNNNTTAKVNSKNSNDGASMEMDAFNLLCGIASAYQYISNNLYAVCTRIYEKKYKIDTDLSLILETLKPYNDLHEYYMEQRQNRERKVLLLAENFFRIYASVYFTYFKYLICVAFILHIWKIVGLWIYTQLYRNILKQEWVWNSRIATAIVIWLAEKIYNSMKINELLWWVLSFFWKPFAMLSYLWSYGTSKYVPVDTRLTIREFTNITSQESKINKSAKKKAKQHLSYQKKNKYDKSLSLSLDKAHENKNMKALIEVKYLQTILRNTRTYYYQTVFSPWVQGEIEIFETYKQQQFEFYDNNSQVTKELSLSCIHSFTDRSLKEVVTLLKDVMSYDTTNCVNPYQLTYNEEEEPNKQKEYSIVHHNMILTLANALLHISPKQYQQIQQQTFVRCSKMLVHFSNRYKQAWFLTSAALEHKDICDDSDESSEAIMRLTIVKLSAAVKGLIHEHVNQRYDWKIFIIGDIERLLTMLDADDLGHDFLFREIQWQVELKTIIYHSALFLNNTKAAMKCVHLFGSDNLVRTRDYQSLLLDIRDSWSHHTEILLLSNGSEDTEVILTHDQQKSSSITEPWWLIWKATKAPPVVDNTSQRKSSGADEETKEKTKTDTQYLRDLPTTDTFKNRGAKFQAIYATVEAGTHHLICLLAKPIGTLLSSQLDDTWEYKAKDECTESAGADDTILHTKLRRGTSYHARKFIYCALTDEWMYSNTIISIDDQLDIETTEKGKQRDVVRVSLRENNQPHVLKINREPKLHHVQSYFSDIRTHQFSRYYVDLFTKITEDRYIRLRMLDAVHIQILENANGLKVMDYGNAELSMEGYKFVKFSNNTGRVNEKLHTDLREIATAFSHFTHHHSQGALMVVDLQGWIRITNDDVELMLTDPAINCPDAQHGFFGSTNWGQAGFDKFWTGQHRKCNKICKKLGLVRPKKNYLAGFTSLFNGIRSIR